MKTSYFQGLISFFRKFCCHIKLAIFLAVFFSPIANAYGPMAQFTMRFAQVILDPSINIHKIRSADNLFILEGVSEKPTAVYHLAEDILKSRKLKPLDLIDSSAVIEGKNFSLYLNSKRLKKANFQVSISSPKIQEVVTGTRVSIQGKCTLNGKNIFISGDIKGATVCKKNNWKINAPLRIKERKTVYVKALHVGTQGSYSLAIRSFQRK